MVPSSTGTRWTSANWRPASRRTANRNSSRLRRSGSWPQSAWRRGRRMAKKVGRKTRLEMPCADPHERAHAFTEVALGYPVEAAVEEANRCIICKNRPCIAGCPVEIDIPKFVEQVAQQDFHGAWRTLTDKNVLPAICGRVCPQEEQCEQKCTLGVKFEPVAIGRLERFVADYASAQGYKADAPVKDSSGHAVAIVGSGPAGLTAAADLARMGHRVTLFEALHKPGRTSR